MKIEKELLKGHSKAQPDKIVGYIGSDSKRFNQLIIIFLRGPYRLTQRAAWPLAYCVRSHPKLIQPHLGKILKMLDKPGIHDAVKRNIVRLLQFIEIPKRYYGSIADKCFKLMDPKERIAVRVFSMTVLATIAQHELELKRELRILIEDQLPFASAGFLSRGKKLLKQLEK